MIPPQAIKELIQIHKEEFNEELSLKEVEQMATDLLNYTKTVFKGKRLCFKNELSKDDIHGNIRPP